MIEFQEEDGSTIDISNTADWFSLKKSNQQMTHFL
jgi:hypothetical protein